MKTLYRIALLSLLTHTAFLSAQVVIDLKTGIITDIGLNPPVRASLTYTNPYLTVSMARLTSCAITPFEALVEMNLKPGGNPLPAEAKRAVVSVEYEGPQPGLATIPSGWVTHIGDDPTNDGFGGGNGLDGVAEVQVLDQALAVYSAGISSGIVDRMLYQELQLAKGSLRFDVANQNFRWGQPYNEVDATFTKKLFALPDAKGDYKLYLGLNRVVGNNAARKGCGARRAVIDLER